MVRFNGVSLSTKKSKHKVLIYSWFDIYIENYDKSLILIYCNKSIQLVLTYSITKLTIDIRLIIVYTRRLFLFIYSSMTKKKLTGIIKYKVKECCVYQNISPKSAKENIYGGNNSKSVLVIVGRCWSLFYVKVKDIMRKYILTTTRKETHLWTNWNRKFIQYCFNCI